MSVQEKLSELVAAHFRVPLENIRPETDFYADLEADILDVPELAMDVEDAFAIMLDSRSVELMKTVGEMLEYINERLEQKRVSLALCLLASKAQAGESLMTAVRYGGMCE